VDGAESTAGLQLEHARPDQYHGRLAVEARKDTLEPVRKREVVRVHAGNTASPYLVEPEVERTCEPPTRLTADDPDTRIVEPGRTSGVSSVDPSSTTTSSRSVTVWRRTLSSAGRR